MPQIIKQDLEISAKECRFAVYVPPPEYGMPDLHLVKENISYTDGSSKPNVILVKDFKRPIWTSRKGFQNYKSKKEWASLSELIETKTTQSTLVENAAKALGTPWFKGDQRKLSASPFLYGSDILSTAIIKKMYLDKFPGVQTKYSVAVFDTETDVLFGTGEIIMATLSYKKTVFTVVKKSFLEGITDIESRVERAMTKYLGEYVDKREIKSELIIADTEIDVIRLCLNKAHELKPDFLAIWNLDFDIGKIITACDKARVDPATLFSDPIVPHQYQYFKYKQGPKKKVTASGKVTPIKPAAQWHTVFTPASFYIIDAMCVYKHVRIGKADEQSYSLDAILNKELGIRKLKFEEANQYTGLKWHEFMQTSYKIEYIIYNRFDCISMEELDEKIFDLSLTFPMFSGWSDFENFKSQPRRAADTIHYYCLEKGKVIASTGSAMSEPVDTETLSLEGWIITLPAHLVADNGLKIIKEHPDLKTNIRSHVGD